MPQERASMLNDIKKWGADVEAYLLMAIPISIHPSKHAKVINLSQY